MTGLIVALLCAPPIAHAKAPPGYTEVAPGVYVQSPAGQEYALYPQTARASGGVPPGSSGLFGSGLTRSSASPAPVTVRRRPGGRSVRPVPVRAGSQAGVAGDEPSATPTSVALGWWLTGLFVPAAAALVIGGYLRRRRRPQVV